MYGPPGHAYIYFNYGMHWMLNISSEPDGTGGAVLLRAIQPTIGLDLIRQRRGATMPPRDLARGPGRICAALGLGKDHNGLPFTGDTLWLDDEPALPPNTLIATSARIGITKGTDLPWRFYLASNPYVSANNSAHPVS
jgi:DNA-3-methyladenine glycosylase